MTEKVLGKIKEMKKDKEFSIKVIESLCKSEKNKELFKGNDEFEKLYDKYIKKDDLDFEIVFNYFKTYRKTYKKTYK